MKHLLAVAGRLRQALQGIVAAAIPDRRRLIPDHNKLKRVLSCGPGARFAWPGRRIVGLIGYVCLALVIFSVPCQAALSPRQLSGADLDPAPGASLPLDAKFVSTGGAPVTLGEAIGNKPAALILLDYTCRFICGTTLAIAASGLSAADLEPGKDFSFVVVGIDPKDKPSDAEAMKKAQLAAYPGLLAAAAFLNGDASAIASVTKALNYTLVYDAETDQYAHPVGAVILTADGRVSRVMSGLNLNPEALKAALEEAGQGGLSSLVEGIRLLCYGHSPLRGAYASAIQAALALAGIVTVGGIAGAVVLFAKRGRTLS